MEKSYHLEHVLIAREDVESYVWVLEKFLSCMGTHPYVILTDPDPALKIAVARVFVNTRHRFCMWHITNKALGKICKLLNDNNAFLKRFNAIVWNDYIMPEKFEVEWDSMISDFELGGENWFMDMYNLRNYWVPAYFLDCPMGGLVKTTSISESVNSFFGKYTRHYANLVEFFMHYDTTIDAQRHSHDRLSSLDESAVFDLRTTLSIESHASSLYSNTIFKDVQTEIVDANSRCRVSKLLQEGDIEMYKVANGKDDAFSVLYNTLDKSFSCECKMYDRVGLLCCHMYFLLKNLDIEKIPERYVTWRWTKQAYSHPVHSNVDTIPQAVYMIDERKVKVRSMYSLFFEILAMVESGSLDNIDVAMNGLRDLLQVVRNGHCLPTSLSSKNLVFEQFYGKSVPKEISVLPPLKIKAKGSGSRFKSKKEIAISLSKKSMRKCSKCKQLATHDARNCKVVLDEDADVVG